MGVTEVVKNFKDNQTLSKLANNMLKVMKQQKAASEHIT